MVLFFLFFRGKENEKIQWFFSRRNKNREPQWGCSFGCYFGLIRAVFTLVLLPSVYSLTLSAHPLLSQTSFLSGIVIAQSCPLPRPGYTNSLENLFPTVQNKESRLLVSLSIHHEIYCFLPAPSLGGRSNTGISFGTGQFSPAVGTVAACSVLIFLQGGAFMSCLLFSSLLPGSSSIES